MRSKIILLLALLLGAVTTFLFFQYMQQFDEEAVKNESMVEVVVAAEKIKENQRITANMLEIAEVPEAGLYPETVRNSTEIDGKYATATIEVGEAILTHRVKSEKEENIFISRKIKDGFRAVSVGVNFVQSISNLIEPDDEVDVVFSEVIKLEENETTIKTEQILSKVRVLAVGRKMIAATSEEEEYVEYSSVSLELKPQDAVKLINASERGNIQFTLHTRVLPPAQQSDYDSNSDGGE